MAHKRESFFWTSFSDLMTSLFFIMLVLFILVIVLMYKRMEATETQLAEIKKVEASTKDLDSHYFAYNESYKKYVLRVEVFFPEKATDINSIPPASRDSLRNAGKEIVKFLTAHSANQYLLIVEGQASRNSEQWTLRNYDLSFQRALNLTRFWIVDCQLNFGKNCEVQIAGSGDGRYNVKSMRTTPESANQRFLIHLLPKNIMSGGDAEWQTGN